MNSQYTLHAADWVVPVSEPPIADGAVVVDQQNIVAVGPYAELAGRYVGADEEQHPQTALTPPLVNGHIHLELSHLSALSKKPLTTDFTGWILSLIELRERIGAVGDQVEQAAHKVLQDQYDSGVSGLVDIGNTEIGTALSGLTQIDILAFKEYLGFTGDRLAGNLQRLEEASEHISCSAHAIYSTHAELIKALHQRAVRRKELFPIHVAESEAENSMLRSGKGDMVRFLEQRGFWDPDFLEKINGRGAVSFLHRLGVLDDKTLCVHCVHVDQQEIELLKSTGAKICLCPGSNRYLQVGKAPLEQFLAAGILPALGTDSLASNPELSIWREMALLAEEHPGVEHSAIFAMATLGGATAMGMDDRVGTLSPGKRAECLKVKLPGSKKGQEELLEFLVTAGTSIQVAGRVQ